MELNTMEGISKLEKCWLVVVLFYLVSILIVFVGCLTFFNINIYDLNDNSADSLRMVVGAYSILMAALMVCISINEEKDQETIDEGGNQRIVRVYDPESLKLCHSGFGLWNSEYTKDPLVIGKILENLRTATTIRLYVTKRYIEYTAEIKNLGQVSGSCHRDGYSFFQFGIGKSGHRWEFYGEDRNEPTIKSFYKWWGDLVKPYENEFNKDYNL